MHVWDAASVRAFLDAVRDDRLSALWRLSAMTGMRRGEVLGVRWGDIDLDGGRLSVRQTLNDVGHVLSFGEPKTAKGRRSIALDAGTVAALREWRAHQREDVLRFGRTDWPSHDLVFTREDGEPVHPAWLSRAFDQRVRAAGLPVIRFHDLRHTAASLSLAAGLHPKVVSERLGHSTISITLDVYSHVIPSMQADAADKLAAIIGG